MIHRVRAVPGGEEIANDPDTDDDTRRALMRSALLTVFDEVHAVIASGIAAYPQIGFPVAPGAPRHGSSEDHDHVMKWAQAVQDAGAVMIDLTMVTPDIYRDVTRSMRIPVIGGQAGPEADGKIWVAWSLVGYLAQTIDAEGDAPSAAKYIYDTVSKAVGDVHAGAW